MDKSKEYVKMCREATEIQNQWEEPRIGDLVFDGHCVAALTNLRWNGQLIVLTEITGEGTGRCKPEMLRKNRIWIPRQGQLQAILKDRWIKMGHNWCGRKVVKALWDWIATTSPPSDYTMEKLWLAFVMKELYSKRWNGETWEAIE